MRSAGIREARQNLSSLIDEVRKGREVVIEERGRPVARLVPMRARSAKTFRRLKAFRDSLEISDLGLTSPIAEDREDRF